jgi:hypothetical protein
MARRTIRFTSLVGAALAVAASSCGGGGDVSCAPAGTYVPIAVRSADPGDCPTAVPPPTWDPITVAANHACGDSTDHFVERRSGTAGEVWCGGDGTTVVTGTSAGISGKSTFVATGCTSGMTCTARYDLTYARQ